MAKVVDVYELIPNGYLVDEDTLEELKCRATRNIWDVKKDAVLEITKGAYTPQKVKTAQECAIEELFAYAKGAVKSGVPFPLVHRIIEKKALLLVNAKTVAEIEEIMHLSFSRFKEGGMILTCKYHIPEEELMLLGIASKMGKLTEQAQERFVFLYEQYYKSKGDVSNE